MIQCLTREYSSHSERGASLNGQGVSSQTCIAIAPRLTGATASLMNSGFHCTGGTKQGDPLSQFLFNCVLDPLLEKLNGSNLGMNLEGTRFSAMAFADDLVLLSDN